MYQALLDESRKIGTFGHGFTYSGHPVAARSALKTLEIYERERIVEAGAGQGAAVPAPPRRRSPTIRWSARRGASGLIGGLELVADKGSKRAIRSEARASPRNASASRKPRG